MVFVPGVLVYEPRSMSFAVVTDLAVKPAKGAYAQLCWVVQHNAVNDSRALNMMNGTTVGVRCAILTGEADDFFFSVKPCRRLLHYY